MATINIVLSAYPGRRVREVGCSWTSIGIGIGGGTPTRRLAVQGLGGITEAVSAFGRDVLAANPEASFVISVTMASDQRKPRGFDDAERAGTFGQHAHLRDDVGEEVNYRKLASPTVSAPTPAPVPA